MEGLRRMMRPASYAAEGPAGLHRHPFAVAKADKIVKGRKLSVIEEDSSNTRHESISNVVSHTNEDQQPPKKTKLTLKPVSTLARTDENSLFLTQPGYGSEPPISPIPLPPGVICIDSETEVTYGQDIVTFVRIRELAFHRVILEGYTNVHKLSRNKLVNWLVEVLHHFKTTQETCYHAINLVDRVLTLWKDIPLEKIQLVGITCVLIASKLEEYYMTEISELLRCTRNSYRSSEVLKMERAIYRCIGFNCYGEEPMIFLQRFIFAAFREGDKMFKELCTFLLDTLLTDLEKWTNLASLKAAAAVYAALHIPISDDKNFQIDSNENPWTPTLKYYSRYDEMELTPLAKSMLNSMAVVCQDIVALENQERSSEDLDDLTNGVRVKYLSRSRHRALLTHPAMTRANACKALRRLLPRQTGTGPA